ncbi:hypothetical protein K435DRAFT_234427 [Dendrothele bispora CBS 962.96]|uniref:Uncharacterized protein n=1 Tax=Dendrothele bispora (strain CBS 962.96) TaxID=1314807 RepID=A0A4S8LPN2_DENBC|nr:hypothetical protein K435DRAFT_234427 [Dendrothele bispora CBS 962.96]
MVPSSIQTYAAQQQRQHSFRSNPNASTTSRRSPLHHVSGQRIQWALPTPPHHNPPSINGDHSSELSLFMSPGSGSAANVNPAQF